MRRWPLSQINVKRCRLTTKDDGSRAIESIDVLPGSDGVGATVGLSLTPPGGKHITFEIGTDEAFKLALVILDYIKISEEKLNGQFLAPDR
jgi:hypothetical protein